MQGMNFEFFQSLVKPRPVGSENNHALQEQLVKVGQELGCQVEQLPFDCFTWEYGDSYFETDKDRLAILPSPFSPSAQGEGELLFIGTLQELRQANLKDRIIVFHGEIASEPLMPKDFPFYDVPEHREIAQLLETGKPLAILSAMGKHPMCGLDPCPMFEDCHFTIPSAFFPVSQLSRFQQEKHSRVAIDSKAVPAAGKQLILRKQAAERPAGKVILCGHMDTAYNTPGALDNAVGLFVTLSVLERLKEVPLRFDLEVIPFNGEDYTEVSGEQAYLAEHPVNAEEISLVINIDDAGHKGSQNALSLYNVPDHWEAQIESLIAEDPQICRGEEWYASDHSMFAAQGVPCLVFASSDLMTETTRLTHTPQDTVEQVDFTLVENMVDAICRLLHELEF